MALDRASHNKEYYQRPEVKEKAAARMRDKYRNNPEVRSRSKEYKLEWYHKNKDKAAECRYARLDKDPLRNQLPAIKSRCKKNNIPYGFDNYTHFLSTVELPTHCPILGVELDYRVKGYDTYRKAQIDRIVPELGYIPGNVKIISAKANQLKQDNTVETLKAILKYMECKDEKED